MTLVESFETGDVILLIQAGMGRLVYRLYSGGKFTNLTFEKSLPADMAVKAQGFKM